MNCRNCKSDCAERGYDRDKNCLGYWGNTNADKIRAMTDEELANFFKKECCPAGRGISDESCHRFGGKCIKCWLNWLKSEVEG